MALTSKERQKIIGKALQTKEGRSALVDAIWGSSIVVEEFAEKQEVLESLKLIDIINNRFEILDL